MWGVFWAWWFLGCEIDTVLTFAYGICRGNLLVCPFNRKTAWSYRITPRFDNKNIVVGYL